MKLSDENKAEVDTALRMEMRRLMGKIDPDMSVTTS